MGIILFEMLFGCLLAWVLELTIDRPWAEASAAKCERFKRFAEDPDQFWEEPYLKKRLHGPPNGATMLVDCPPKGAILLVDCVLTTDLLIRLLDIDPSTRVSIDGISTNPWCLRYASSVTTMPVRPV